MKYALAILFLHLTVFGVAQTYVTKTAKAYYRVDPFGSTFSAFVEALTSDSALLHKQEFKQTDTTGYYIRGQYEIFNPFRINADRVDLIFYENNTQVGQLPLNYYTYQITAYFPDTDLTRREIKKEFKNLVKSLRRDLYTLKLVDLKDHEGIEEGKIVMLTDNDFRIEPAVVSWQTLSKTNQLGLTLILKLKHVRNKVLLVNEAYFW